MNYWRNHQKLNDVTKETDLSRFYRNVLERKTTGAPSSTTEEQEQDREKEDRHDYTDTFEQNDNEPLDEAGSEDDEGGNNDEGSGNEGSPPEKETDELDEEERQEAKEDSPPVPTVPEPQPETVEERRKRIFAKRTNEESALSAKERYLARKRAKLSEPTVITEDD
uniref:Uncharacterized protein n=1 Tax=Amphimedon queenslandica TaxID=400682 RepID=A0A1X7UMV9_AMPQE